MEQAQKKQEGVKDIVTHYSYRIITESDKVKWVDQYSKTIPFAGKNADFINILDISERKRADEALRESEEKYRSLVESTEDSIYLLDRNCEYLFANKKLQSIFGLPVDKIIGRKYGDFHSKDETKNFAEKVNKVFETVQSLSYEYRSKRDNRYFIRTLSPVKEPDKKVTALTLISKDITERVQAEEKIKASLKEKEVLLREVHHRVKNNMQVINSLLKLQFGRIKEKKYADMLKDSQGRIKSMALVHEKLYQTKDFAKIDFNGYIKSLANSLFRSYGVNPKKIALKIEVEDVALGLDSAIPCGLIVNELVSNSLKHAFPNDRDGEIRIAFGSINEDELELEFRDNGIGIPEHIDIRDTDTSGLHLVMLLAEKQLRGKIELDSVRGTKYHIQFKRVKEKVRI
jgi:PAS domain S-box-containing protein